jgi:hypothetical protein
VIFFYKLKNISLARIGKAQLEAAVRSKGTAGKKPTILYGINDKFQGTKSHKMHSTGDVKNLHNAYIAAKEPETGLAWCVYAPKNHSCYSFPSTTSP